MSDLGTVVPFVQRAANGDWSSGERARLAELADRLTARGARVDASYGVSDRGDPWCVITDDQDEVLVHVARIDGRFVVHDAASDAVQDEESLWRAFERLLGRAWREGREDVTVTPLREAQSLLALVAALVFVREVGQAVAPSHAQPDLHSAFLDKFRALLHSAAADDHHGAAQWGPSEVAALGGRHAAAAGSASASAKAASAMTLAQADDAHTTTVATAPGHASALAGGQLRVAHDRGEVLAGGPGDDLLIGGRGGDHLIGGDGADTLIGGGARVGELDVLEGGGGDDQLRLAARTVAIGGEGHNVFVIAAPDGAMADGGDRTRPGTPVDSGVILDFTAQDRFEFTAGFHPTVVSVTPQDDVLAGLHGYTALARTGVTPGFRVGFDINGDGRADVYVTVAGPAAAGLTPGWRPEGAPLQPGSEHPIGFTGGGHPPPAGAFVLGS